MHSASPPPSHSHSHRHRRTPSANLKQHATRQRHGSRTQPATSNQSSTLPPLQLSSLTNSQSEGDTTGIDNATPRAIPVAPISARYRDIISHTPGSMSARSIVPAHGDEPSPTSALPFFSASSAFLSSPRIERRLLMPLTARHTSNGQNNHPHPPPVAPLSARSYTPTRRLGALNTHQQTEESTQQYLSPFPSSPLRTLQLRRSPLSARAAANATGPFPSSPFHSARQLARTPRQHASVTVGGKASNIASQPPSDSVPVPSEYSDFIPLFGHAPLSSLPAQCEFTLALLNPDIVARGLVPRILRRIIHAGLSIVRMEECIVLNEEQVRQLYVDKQHELTFPLLMQLMMSGPLVALAIAGAGAVARWKQMVGPLSDADTLRLTCNDDETRGRWSLRAIFGQDVIRNGFHVSSSIDTARKELNLAFGPDGWAPLMQESLLLIKPDATSSIVHHTTATQAMNEANGASNGMVNNPIEDIIFERLEKEGYDILRIARFEHGLSSEQASILFPPHHPSTDHHSKYQYQYSCPLLQQKIQMEKLYGRAGERDDEVSDVDEEKQQSPNSLLGSKSSTSTASVVSTSDLATPASVSPIPNPIYTAAISFLQSGPVIALRVKAPSAIRRLKCLLGGHHMYSLLDPTLARTIGDLTCVRAQYGRDVLQCCAHVSASLVEGRREVSLMFDDRRFAPKMEETMLLVTPKMMKHWMEAKGNQHHTHLPTSSPALSPSSSQAEKSPSSSSHGGASLSSVEELLSQLEAAGFDILRHKRMILTEEHVQNWLRPQLTNTDGTTDSPANGTSSDAPSLSLSLSPFILSLLTSGPCLATHLRRPDAIHAVQQWIHSQAVSPVINTVESQRMMSGAGNNIARSTSTSRRQSGAVADTNDRVRPTLTVSVANHDPVPPIPRLQPLHGVIDALYSSSSASIAQHDIDYLFHTLHPQYERSLLIAKPDIFPLKNASGGRVIEEIEVELRKEAGLDILRRARLHLDESQVRELYSTHRGRVFMPDLIRYMCSGPIMAWEIGGIGAVRKLRQVLGPTDPAQAKTGAPHSMRARWGVDITQNGLHGSMDAPEAERELKLIFDCYVPALETSCAILKPEVLAAGYHMVRSVLQEMRSVGGFEILRSEQMHLNQSQAMRLYAPHAGSSYFHSLVQHMASGPILAMELRKEHAVKAWREMMGPTDSSIARRIAPHTLRARYGLDRRMNGLHGSASVSEAKREIQLLFNEFSVGMQESVLLLTPTVAAKHEVAIRQYLLEEGFSIVKRGRRAMTRSMAERFLIDKTRVEGEDEEFPTNELDAAIRMLTGKDGSEDDCHASPEPDDDKSTAHPCVAFLVRKEDGVRALLDLVGSPNLDPDQLRTTEPECIRARFGHAFSSTEDGLVGEAEEEEKEYAEECVQNDTSSLLPSLLSCGIYASPSLSDAGRDIELFSQFIFTGHQSVCLLVTSRTSNHTETGFTELSQSIMSVLEKEGIQIKRTRLCTLTPIQATEFLRLGEREVDGDGDDASTFGQRVTDLCSGPILALELFGEDTIRTVHSILDQAVTNINFHVSANDGAAKLECQMIFDALANDGNSETILAILKPDALKRGVEETIVQRLKDEGFTIVSSKRMQLATPQARALCSASSPSSVACGSVTTSSSSKSSSSATAVVDHLTSAPVLCLVLRRTDALKHLHEIAGNENPKHAKKTQPNSLRALYGLDSVRNVIHCPSSLDAARHAMNVIFGEE